MLVNGDKHIADVVRQTYSVPLTSLHICYILSHGVMKIVGASDSRSSGLSVHHIAELSAACEIVDPVRFKEAPQRTCDRVAVFVKSLIRRFASVVRSG
jgi:hypothetical protein